MSAMLILAKSNAEIVEFAIFLVANVMLRIWWRSTTNAHCLFFHPFTRDLVYPPLKRWFAVRLLLVQTQLAFRKKLREHGLEQVKKFTWDDCTKAFLASIDWFNRQPFQDNETP